MKIKLVLLIVFCSIVLVGCGQDLTGTYYEKNNPNSYFEFKSDGTVANKASGSMYYGKYKIKGDTVTVSINGYDYPLKIKGNELINEDDKSDFVKK